MSKCIYDFDPGICQYSDYYKKYNGTIMLVDGMPHYADIGDGRTRFSNKCLNSELLVDSNSSGIDAGLAPWFPDNGWALYNGYLYYIARTNNRQWRKSYCDGTYQGLSLYHKAMPAIPLKASQTFMQLLPKNQQSKCSFSLESLGNFENAKVKAQPINKLFAVSKFEDGTLGLLCPWGLAGYIKPSERLLYIREQLLQEATDLTKDGDTQWQIKLF